MKWFKHMSSLRHDPRVKRLIRKYGSDGYTIYVSTVEMIADTLEPTGKIIPYLEEDIIDLADEFSIDSARVNEIFNYCIKQELFEESTSGMIFCFKLYNFVDEYFTKGHKNSEKAISRNRTLITAYKEGGLPCMLPLLIDLVPTASGLIGQIKSDNPDLLQSDSRVTLDKLPQEESTVEESTESTEIIIEEKINKKEFSSYIPKTKDLELTGFQPDTKNTLVIESEKWYKEYPRKQDGSKAKEKYIKLAKANKLPSLNEHVKILEQWKNSEEWKDPKYIPLPTTWLNRERWLDDFTPTAINAFETNSPQVKF